MRSVCGGQSTGGVLRSIWWPEVEFLAIFRFLGRLLCGWIPSKFSGVMGRCWLIIEEEVKGVPMVPISGGLGGRRRWKFDT